MSLKKKYRASCLWGTRVCSSVRVHRWKPEVDFGPLLPSLFLYWLKHGFLLTQLVWLTSLPRDLISVSWALGLQMNCSIPRWSSWLHGKCLIAWVISPGYILQRKGKVCICPVQIHHLLVESVDLSFIDMEDLLLVLKQNKKSTTTLNPPKQTKTQKQTKKALLSDYFGRLDI